MAFLKRLGFYLFGLSIGLVFLTIFLKNKSEETGVEFCYFPNCRTLKDIRSKKISYSNEIDQMIRDKQLDSLTIMGFLNDGEVDFKNSDTKSTPCKTYLIESEVNDVLAKMTVQNCPDSAVVQNVRF
ncbi:DUF4258 domain-containing protein [Maribacter sp. TH_r10]|uniref:DUF4258 domain-containing protein n=1 Tax=Maribacter TaxID=252356 RepID=UPI0024936416|nr:MULTISPECIES: DUF4258 domain-containing protein [Maribacter]MDV7138901.1 DUF4258 domain-containing protein [Maribacter sp. TH_r10]|tara:strand:+ start:615 stop:995 length:381 start_codon:yes stop_codon:yes gene_type:complete